ncbi:hypothetical protein HYX58_02600 [Candidatus Dependentiae bacterium]|nr:hypothetical protein [Candidatus Dependentiae bacterium]
MNNKIAVADYKSYKFPFIIGILLLILTIIGTSVLIFNYYHYKLKLNADLVEAIESNTTSVTDAITLELKSLAEHITQFYTLNKSLPRNEFTNNAIKFLKGPTLIKEIDLITTESTFAFIKTNNDAVDQKKAATLPQSAQANEWTEPFYSENLNTKVIAYQLVTSSNERILFLLPLSAVQQHLISLNPLVTSLNFLIHEDGTIIVHPSTPHIGYRGERSIFDILFILPGDARYKDIQKIIKNPEGGVINFPNEVSGQETWVVVSPLGLDSLKIAGICYPIGVAERHSTMLRHKIFQISMGCLLIACLASILLAGWFSTILAWWLAAMSIAFFCTLQLFFLWNQEIKHGLERHTDYTVIADQNQLNVLIGSLQEKYSMSPLFKHVNFIPTGVFLEKIIFSRESNDVLPSVLVSGYVWQRYAKSLTIKPAFIMPDAFSLQTDLLQSSSRGHEDYYLWQFSCKLYAIDTFLTYPFDHRHINLRILHPVFNENTILIPDLDAYTQNDPKTLPGISALVSISSWFFQSSFFNYRKNHYNATLDSANTAFMSLPQFNFSFICQRTLIGEFITYLILLVLTIIFLFILLLTFSKEENLMGFTNLDVLIALSGLLFVLILSQVSLRQALGVIGISYIESFYFICYFFLTAIAIDSTLFVMGRGGQFIQYNNNLIPKLIYWPLFFLLAVLATYFSFY